MGVEVSRCASCGVHVLSVPELDGLHRLLARTLIEKETRLAASEIRFLRRCLGLSSTELARRMGVAIETVSRWENTAAPIGPQADRLLRLLVSQCSFGAPYPEENLDRIDGKNATETKLAVRLQGSEWVVATVR